MNMGYQNIRYYTPYHVFNPFQINPRNNFILDISKDSIKYPFSQIGYQIMNPQYINYDISSSSSIIEVTADPRISDNDFYIIKSLCDNINIPIKKSSLNIS